METLNGTSLSEPLKPPPSPQSPHHSFADKKRLHRAPSPARPFLKDLHARASSAKPPPVPPKSPSLSGKPQPQQGGARPQSPGLLATQSRLSRRSCAQGAKAAAGLGGGAPGKAGSAKSALSSKKAARAQDQAGGRASGRQLGGESVHHPSGKGRKGKRCAALAQPGSLAPAASLSSGPAGRISHTDSSSDLSDCPSEPLSDEQRLAQAASSDAESGTGSSDREQPPPAAPLASGPGGGPQHALPPSTDPSNRGPAAPPASPAPPGSKGEQQQQQGDEATCGRAPEKAPPKSAQPAGSGRLGGKAPMVLPCERGRPAAAAAEEEEEELLREIEELRSENDYLKVLNGGKGGGRIGPAGH